MTSATRRLVGRRVRIPFVERDVPVIADDVVEPEFGTGRGQDHAPHDHDDFATGKRHGLPAHRRHDRRRTINENAARTPAWTARCAARILEDLDARGDLAGERRTRW